MFLDITKYVSRSLLRRETLFFTSKNIILKLLIQGYVVVLRQNRLYQGVAIETCHTFSMRFSESKDYLLVFLEEQKYISLRTMVT